MAGPHLKQHPINSTDDHGPGTNGTLLGTESSALAEKAFGTAATAGLIVQRDGAGQIDVPLVPTAPEHAASRDFVLATALNGTVWKELLLHPDQLLSGGSGGILQAILANISVNPTSGDNFIISDGTTTRTYGFGTGGDVTVTIGGSAAATQTNLAAAITGDGGGLWDAVEATGLDDYFAGAPAAQLVIHRTATTPTATADRVYSTVGTTSNIQVVEFATGQQDYQDSSGTESNIPGADPTAKRFGFGREFAALTQNEAHILAENNTTYTWDADDDTWQLTGTGTATTAGDGIDVTAGKVSTDVATAVAAQQYGGLVNNRNADGSAAAGADLGYNAVQTDDVTLEVNASNQVAIKAGSVNDQLTSHKVWESETSPDKSPTLAEYQAALGTTAGDIGKFVLLVERSTVLGQTISAGGAGGIGSTSSFWVLKVANAGALADYQVTEMSPAG